MIVVPDFDIKDTLLSDERRTVCRAMRLRDGQAVILKICTGEFSDTREMAKLRREYDIARQLDFEGAVRTLELHEFTSGAALVMEDFGGMALSQIAGKKPLPLDSFFPIAIRLTEMLAELHHRNIIHKDIKPDNILVDPKRKDVRLIDFGIATLLTNETVGIVSHSELEGSLHYISPEQTGRMNRPIDYRSDLYSLGATFYELLTGTPPFPSGDAAVLVHAHLARMPISPTEANPAVPAVLSELVLKLLEKSPESRYQSLKGLKADLEKCALQWQRAGSIEPFPLGENDVSDRFLIPQKLYGREWETEFLLDAFDEAAQGDAVLLTVSGFSGIGKTKLIEEIHKPVVAQRGYFIHGKFDQFNRDAPYSAGIEAFGGLIRQLLSESDASIAAWKEKLLNALGSNAGVIAEVLPELELIIGKQPAPVVLPPSESQNRFNLAFLQFVSTFTKPAHPLVFFVDDMQWADIPSLKLLELLMADKETAHLLFICAYRDNEVNAAHPLIKTFESLKAQFVPIKEITLAPLQFAHISQIIADTLHCPPGETAELSKLILEKTGGNPFFVNEFLKSLHQEKLFVFDHAEHRWYWDLEKIKLRDITDNVVELMSGKIRLLDEKAQRLCQYAACIGNKFDLHTLATVYEKPLHLTAKDLRPAILEGLIVPVGNAYRVAEIPDAADSGTPVEYRFLHDRVQQAAYDLIPDSDKQALHLKIGRLMLGHFSEEEKRERLFEVANQFNAGIQLIEEEAERNQLATLNLMAGKRAKNSAAHEPAWKYLSTGTNLLPPDAWQRYYDLTLELHNESAEAAYLSGDFDSMVRLTGVVFDHAAELLHKVKAYSIKIQGYLSLTRNGEALSTCLEVLELLGVKFPSKPSKLHIVKSLIETKLRLRGKSADQLVGQPNMTDPKATAIMEILPYTASASYFAKPDLFPLVVFKQVSLSVKYGNHIQSAFAYATYGLVMCGSTLEFDEGQKFGDIAVRVLEKLNGTAVYSRVHFVHSGFILQWRVHFRHCLDGLLNAYQKGLENGDFTYGSYAIFNYCFDKLYMGELPLPSVKAEMDAYVAALHKIKQNTSIVWLNIPQQAVANLLDENQISARFLGPHYDETTETERQIQGKDLSGLCVYYLCRMMLSYLFDETEEALENGEKCVKLLDAVLATPHVMAIHHFYALTLLRTAEKTPAKRQQLIKKAQKTLRLIKKFAKSGPANNLAKQHLVDAEIQRLKGNAREASILYKNAIATANAHGFTNEEAIANELYARFLAASAPEQSRQYLLEARRLYQKWGAVAKVNQLDQQHGLKAPTTTTSDTYSSRSGSHSSDELDMLSLTKAALAISGEIHLDKLMSKLMHVVVENAGAQNGYLIIERNGQWQLEAKGSVEEEKEPKNATESAVTSHEPASAPLHGNELVPESVIQYVARTREDLVIGDIQQDTRFSSDPVAQKNNPRSVLCLPVINQGKIIGILYLENKLSTGVFTEQRVQIMKLLSGQVAVSLENALQYERLEQKVAERTAEVMRQKDALEKSLTELKMAQAKLVESEKMASLGQLTAGIAHEINNPINFVSVGVRNLVRNFEEVKEVMDTYLNPNADTDKVAQQLSEKQRRQQILEIFEDSDTLFKSIQKGVDRTIGIVKSLRNFSRLDEGELKAVDIHEGLDSTLEILQSQIKKKAEVVRRYGELPLVECAAGKINQVFLNIINNALQAIEERGTITLETNFLKENNAVEIIISDTGKGMSEEVKRRLFEPFFTTKPVGEGTGLGLSISYSIIEEHKGSISVESPARAVYANNEQGKGATFVITLPVTQGV